jgi:hypothetical protein
MNPPLPFVSRGAKAGAWFAITHPHIRFFGNVGSFPPLEAWLVIVSSPETSHGLNSTAVTVRYFCSVSFSKTKFFTEDLPEPHPP